MRGEMRRDDRKSFIPGPQILRSLFPLLPVCFFLSALCGDYRLQWSRRSLLLSFVSGSPRKDTTVVSSQSATATATAPKVLCCSPPTPPPLFHTFPWIWLAHSSLPFSILRGFDVAEFDPFNVCSAQQRWRVAFRCWRLSSSARPLH